MTLFYISFATSTEFLGATVVEADGAEHALTVAKERGLNPGGEVAIIRVPPEAESAPDVVAIRNRLADKAEMLAHGGKRHGDLSEQLRNKVEATIDFVCEDCNPGRK